MWNLDDKHSLRNPVCFPERPDSYLFPKEIEMLSLTVEIFCCDTFPCLDCLPCLGTAELSDDRPPPFLFKKATVWSPLATVRQAKGFYLWFETLKTIDEGCNKE